MGIGVHSSRGLWGRSMHKMNWWTPGLLLLQLNQWTPGLLLLRLIQWTSLYLELQRMSLYPSLDLRTVCYLAS